MYEYKIDMMENHFVARLNEDRLKLVSESEHTHSMMSLRVPPSPGHLSAASIWNACLCITLLTRVLDFVSRKIGFTFVPHARVLLLVLA